MDPNFPFVAFSHDQIKTSTTKSFLLADRQNFKEISDRLLSIDSTVLSSLASRMMKEDFVKAQNAEEDKCFKLLHDLDHIQGAIKGSNTSKKWMRNEIWSLVYHCGAPFWYITLSPADVKHPICIYYASQGQEFKPSILPYDKRLRLICQNPVACARFFHFMVTTFIKHVLGVNANHDGAYGPVNAYYGTVEQQGRLALHLHMVIWLKGNLTPKEMRNCILDTTSPFQQKLISWVESCQMGEFITGTQEQILQKSKLNANQPMYEDPTETMPQAPPPHCKQAHNNNETCKQCTDLKIWDLHYTETVDDIVSKSNIHNCDRNTNKDGTTKKNMTYVGCKNNKYGVCKARFPRPIQNKTEVDKETGAIHLRKLEPWINTFTPLLTYLTRCNTDVTCMWSGTAIKAVLIYISDYITKTGLKTHVVFETIKSIFDKHRDIVVGSMPEKEKARMLINKMVNLLSTKLELGAPMVCMYLLDNPDHYKNHTFIPFHWESYVKEAQAAWSEKCNP
jgi:hypothetical protein